MGGTSNPAFAKLTERNFAIVAGLESVASESGRGMAQLALNWVAHRPGVASVIAGATKLSQLEENLAALDFAVPVERVDRLDKISALRAPFPYSFFAPEMQAMLSARHAVGDKPDAMGATRPLMHPQWDSEHRALEAVAHWTGIGRLLVAGAACSRPTPAATVQSAAG